VEPAARQLGSISTSSMPVIDTPAPDLRGRHLVYTLKSPRLACLTHHRRACTRQPLTALRTQPPFREYHLIDADPTRTGQLTAYAHGAANVHVYPGDCNDIVLNRVFPSIRYASKDRALCLLDPYNIDLRWEVVAAAGRTKAIEIFLNFMVMDMNMNVLLRDPNRADPAQVARMTRFWGDDSWHKAAYEADRQGSFFEDRVIKVDDANEKIAEAYRQRLLNVAGFNYVPAPLALKNSLDKTIYHLFFASPNKTGTKIVEHLFDKHRKQ
jgi:three-Cys-motif partner protein